MRDVIGYEEKDPATLARMTSGYPRFVVHPLAQEVAAHLAARHRVPTTHARWLTAGPLAAQALAVHLQPLSSEVIPVNDYLSLVHFPADADQALAARRYLQHTGLFASSRAAEDYLLAAGGQAEHASAPITASGALAPEAQVCAALAQVYGHGAAPERDVFLAPSGMNATWGAFQALDRQQRALGRTRWVQLGWLYLDTICLLQKFTAYPKEDYLHHADVFDLAGLRQLFAEHAGRVAGLVAEAPTNPLIQTPDISALRALCREHGVALVLDPTIASPYNVDVLGHADVVVNSLTKYAASEGDVIAGAVVVNPASPFAAALRAALPAALGPVYPRDLACLAAQINAAPALLGRVNAAAPVVVAFLRTHPRVASVHWATEPRSAAHYAAIARAPASGPAGPPLGSVLSFAVHGDVTPVYDRLRLAKGPSFGLTCSLICPFMYLAHYDLVKTAEGCAYLERQGIAPQLLRLSLGTEPVEEIIAALAEALA
jgi:cystathionine gamma-synthase